MNTKKNALLIPLFFALFLCGFSGLLYEVIFLLLANIIIGARAFSTSLVLSLFLLGLSLGALIGGALSRRPKNYSFFFSLSNLGCALLVLLTLLTFNFLYNTLTLLPLACIGAVVIFLIPILQGMNIPIAVRILETSGEKHGTGFVYFANTLGSVFGALLTGVIILPLLGFNGAFILGIALNIIVALILLPLKMGKKSALLVLLTILVPAPLFFFNSTQDRHKNDFDLVQNIYLKKSQFDSMQPITVLFSEISPYQHILIAQSEKFGKELFLNGDIQVSEYDSEKYHEYLILPAINAQANPKSILIAGEGDGGGVYQALRYNFQRIDQVELDNQVIQVSKKFLPSVNKGALDNPRVNRQIMDAFQFIKKTPPLTYDIVILAFPDPYQLELSSLFSKEFYKATKKILTKNGVVIIQAGDMDAINFPYAYLEAQACILNTVRSVFPYAYLYRTSIPSWGSNSFIIASINHDPREVINTNALSGKWYTKDKHNKMFQLNKSVENYLNNNSIRVNTLFNPILHFYMQPNYYATTRS